MTDFITTPKEFEDRILYLLRSGYLHVISLQSNTTIEDLKLDQYTKNDVMHIEFQRVFKNEFGVYSSLDVYCSPMISLLVDTKLTPPLAIQEPQTLSEQIFFQWFKNGTCVFAHIKNGIIDLSTKLKYLSKCVNSHCLDKLCVYEKDGCTLVSSQIEKLIKRFSYISEDRIDDTILAQKYIPFISCNNQETLVFESIIQEFGKMARTEILLHESNKKGYSASFYMKKEWYLMLKYHQIEIIKNMGYSIDVDKPNYPNHVCISFNVKPNNK
jgi:hypothetical protein